MGCFASVAALGAALTLASGGDDRLTVGIGNPFPPYVMETEAEGLHGFDVDLITEICTRAAYDCSLQAVTFDELIPGVMDGRYDLALGGMGITPERLALVDFTTPYFTSDSEEWFIGRPGAPQPDSARIAVQSGTLHESYLRHEGLRLQSYPSQDAAVQAVVDGHADLALGPYEHDGNGADSVDIKGLDLLYSVDVPNLGTAIAVCKGNDALLTRLNGAMDTMFDDGTIGALDLRWF